MYSTRSSVLFPKQFLERLAYIVSDTSLDEVLHAFETDRPVTFRVNTLKTNSTVLIAMLEQAGIVIQPVEGFPDTFVLKHGDTKTLTALDAYTNGEFYIQNLSSMIPALVLDPQINEHILDIAAAPGSKTTQIAALMQNTGEIVANDRSHARLFKLKANLASQGVSNTVVTQMPGEIIWKKYPEYFDRALVDVPCTMEGRFTASDPDSYKDWSIKKIKMLTQTQRYLLRSAVSATKPGGVIVYSTCTLAPEENEAIIDWLLSVEKDAVTVEPIALGSISTMPGMTTWGKKQFHPSLKNTVRILPSTTMEGFFVAKIKKRTATISKDKLILRRKTTIIQ